MSMTSCTSPRDSAIGLPISRVISAASACLFARTSSPRCWITSPRTGAGTAAQPACASAAACAARTNVSASPSSASDTRSARLAGFGIWRRPPGASSTGRPFSSELTVCMPRWYGYGRPVRWPRERSRGGRARARRVVPRGGRLLDQARVRQLRRSRGSDRADARGARRAPAVDHGGAVPARAELLHVAAGTRGTAAGDLRRVAAAQGARADCSPASRSSSRRSS